VHKNETDSFETIHLKPFMWDLFIWDHVHLRPRHLIPVHLRPRAYDVYLRPHSFETCSFTTVFIWAYVHLRPCSFETTFIWDKVQLRSQLFETTFIRDHSHLRPRLFQTTFIWDHIPLKPHWFETTFVWDHIYLRPHTLDTAVIWDHIHLNNINFTPCQSEAVFIYYESHFHDLPSTFLRTFTLSAKTVVFVEITSQMFFLYAVTFLFWKATQCFSCEFFDKRKMTFFSRLSFLVEN